MKPVNYNIESIKSVKATNWGFEGKDCLYNPGILIV